METYVEIDRLLFREALPADCDRIMEIIRQAQAAMRARGSDQWQHGYPAEEDIRRDVDRRVGRVLVSGDRVVAYGAVIYDGEAAYAAIEGRWLADRPYVVVHRMAVAREAQRCGVARIFLRRTADEARSRGIRTFRVDTAFDNEAMLHLVASEGFVRCGIIRYDGDPRIAFERVLERFGRDVRL